MYYSYIVLLAIAKTAWVSSTPSLTGDIESTLIHLRQIAGLFQHVHTAGNSQWTKTLRTDKQKINNCRTQWDWDPVFLLAVATASGLCLDESFFMGLHQAGVKLSDHQQKPFAFPYPLQHLIFLFSTRFWVHKAVSALWAKTQSYSPFCWDIPWQRYHEQSAAMPGCASLPSAPNTSTNLMQGSFPSSQYRACSLRGKNCLGKKDKMVYLERVYHSNSVLIPLSKLFLHYTSHEVSYYILLSLLCRCWLSQPNDSPI